jgi:hypothetical protein
VIFALVSHVPTVAFDAKSFRRGKYIPVVQGGISSPQYKGFNSQLGIGIVFKNDDKFVDTYESKIKELRKSFEIQDALPFYSSTYLKQIIGLNKAIPFADQLIQEIQGYIDRIHCTYAVLPPATIPEVQVGGFKCPSVYIPTRKFLDVLGPMFSYLTAYSFIFENRFNDISNLDFHIDAFRSRQTEAWQAVLKNTKPKIFFRGDECNPFISCADIIAFLTDAKLYSQRLKLERDSLYKVWQDYSFKTTSHFLDHTTLGMYTWKADMPIDYRKFLAKPTIFLLIDEIEKAEYGLNDEAIPKEDVGVEIETSLRPKPRKFHEVIKKTDVYYSAVRYAYLKKGCVKIFRRDEDMDMIEDGDILVYVGSSSQKVAAAYSHSFDIEIMSGKDLRKKMKAV